MRSVTAEGALQHTHGLLGRSDRLVLFYSSAVLGVSLKPDLWADLLTAPFLSQVLLILSPSLPSTPNQTLLLLPFYSMPLSISFASYRISFAHPRRSQGTNGAPNPMRAKQIHQKAQSMYHGVQRRLLGTPTGLGPPSQEEGPIVRDGRLGSFDSVIE